VKTLEETDETGRSGQLDAVEERLERLAWEGLCRAGTRARRLSSLLSRFTASTFSESERVGSARAVHPTTRAVRFNGTEYGVPREDAVEAFRSLRDAVESHDVMFPVEFRDVAGEDIPLSPAHGRESTFLAVHAYHRRDWNPLMTDVEAIFDRYEGRPHWGKHHTKTADAFAELYPEWDAFRELRRELDPTGRFLNDHLRAIFRP
jgi:L-gulonolactone oxidase